MSPFQRILPDLFSEVASSENFYGRSSLRQVPRLTRTWLGASNFDLIANSDRPRTYVDRDERFENDLETITRDILRYIYQSDQEKQIIFDNWVAQHKR